MTRSCNSEDLRFRHAGSPVQLRHTASLLVELVTAEDETIFQSTGTASQNNTLREQMFSRIDAVSCHVQDFWPKYHKPAANATSHPLQSNFMISTRSSPRNCLKVGMVVLHYSLGLPSLTRRSSLSITLESAGYTAGRRDY